METAYPLQYPSLPWLTFRNVLVQTVVAPLFEKPTPFTTSSEVKSAVESNMAFALDLYQKLREQPGNLVFSPYSISSALAMACAGARNQTETEMARTMRFDQPQTKINGAFGVLCARIKNIQRWNRITLTTANSLWCQRGYHFASDFLDLARTYYDGEIRQTDFSSAQAAASAINDWDEQKTEGRIKSAIESNELTRDTRLVLCNAIYFKGKWQNEFKTSDTKPMNFDVNTNHSVTVQMMHQTADFKLSYNEDDTVEMLELPYSGTDLSMIILLPTLAFYIPGFEQGPLADMEQNLTIDNLHACLGKLDQAGLSKTTVYLPRFAAMQTFDLANDLKAMGMTSAFNGSADFSGMEATASLFISDVVHKAFVQINEAGTEAAAVTWIEAKTKGGPERFTANHPFIFLIRDNASGSILFMGRIINPNQP
jgi:serpin B